VMILAFAVALGGCVTQPSGLTQAEKNNIIRENEARARQQAQAEAGMTREREQARTPP
jgi:starvation-inducible outer membrane lipoprotein